MARFLALADFLALAFFMQDLRADLAFFAETCLTTVAPATVWTVVISRVVTVLVAGDREQAQSAAAG